MTKKRNMVLVLCLVLVTALVSVGGTIAWITTKTQTLTNTFTVGDINIELNETTTNYKMVPGNDIAKDPKVTVKTGSEASWLFVEIVESANFDDYMTYAVADGWTLLSRTESDGNDEDVYVYYRKEAATTDDVTYSVLAGDEVTVRTDVTKADLTTNLASQPTLTFTAYAIQQDNFNDTNKTEAENAAAAWAAIPKNS